MGSRSSVLIVEDHPLYRLAVAEVLRSEPMLELVGSFADGMAGLAAIRERQPQAAIVDLSLPGLDGTALIRAVREARLRTRLLVVSASTDEGDVYRALAAGADGYLSKDASPEAIRSAIRSVVEGGHVLAPGLDSVVVTAIHRYAIRDDDELTAREIEILALAADGFGASEIATRLHIAVGTVKTHFANIYEKLGVRDRAAAVMEGVRRGALPVAPPAARP